jgi:hypothetical protein
MSPQPLHLYEPAFRAWTARVARLVRERMGVAMSELGPLPLRDGFEVGDSPAEFYAGAVEGSEPPAREPDEP